MVGKVISRFYSAVRTVVNIIAAAVNNINNIDIGKLNTIAVGAKRNITAVIIRGKRIFYCMDYTSVNRKLYLHSRAGDNHISVNGFSVIKSACVSLPTA